jgi:hypothetical protein
MDEAGADPVRRVARRAANRLMQWLVTGSMRAALRAEAAGPEALQRYTAGQRRTHMRFDTPILARLDVEAVRQAGPAAGLPPPPAPAEWFAPRAAAPRGVDF